MSQVEEVEAAVKEDQDLPGYEFKQWLGQRGGGCPHSISKGPYISRWPPRQMEPCFGATGKAGANKVALLGKLGVLGYYAAAVTKLNSSEVLLGLA